MKRSRIYEFQKTIDSNYSAHKGFIPIPLKVRNIKSVCPILHNAEGYISLLKEVDEEQILNEMRLTDDKMHFNSKKVDVDVFPDNTDIKFILRLTKIFNTKDITGYVTKKTGEIQPIFNSTCTLKILIEYEEDV